MTDARLAEIKACYQRFLDAASDNSMSTELWATLAIPLTRLIPELIQALEEVTKDRDEWEREHWFEHDY